MKKIWLGEFVSIRSDRVWKPDRVETKKKNKAKNYSITHTVTESQTQKVTHSRSRSHNITHSQSHTITIFSYSPKKFAKIRQQHTHKYTTQSIQYSPQKFHKEKNTHKVTSPHCHTKYSVFTTKISQRKEHTQSHEPSLSLTASRPHVPHKELPLAHTVTKQSSTQAVKDSKCQPSSTSSQPTPIHGSRITASVAHHTQQTHMHSSRS